MNLLGNNCYLSFVVRVIIAVQRITYEFTIAHMELTPKPIETTRPNNLMSWWQ
jgi:hypothetical protein